MITINEIPSGAVDIRLQSWLSTMRLSGNPSDWAVAARIAALEAQVKAADGLATMLENCLEVMKTPDQQQCCDGRECGCMGSTVYQEAEFYARQELATFHATKEASHE